MTVLRIKTMRWLPGSTNIEPMWQRDMNMLIGILGHTWSDNRKVFFFIATGRARIDKSRMAGLQVFVPYQAFSQFHSAVHPPSTLRLVPVVLPLRSLRRNTQALATSSRLASFFIGIMSITKS